MACSLANRYPVNNCRIDQPDFTSTGRHPANDLSPKCLARIGARTIDEEGQRLFVVDSPNNRILVFDIHQDGLTNDLEAVAVIGQPDFTSGTPGIGPAKFSGVSCLAYDPVLKRLFAADRDNHLVLVFDVDPKQPNRMK